MAKYKCSKTKDEILKAIVERFYRANERYIESAYTDDVYFGAQAELSALMQELKIYEVEDEPKTITDDFNPTYDTDEWQ